ncbi:hypothetical protein [Mucilaginibacter rubeus]|uniref:Uncharacterized protein n=1 Tax=Mucilaginibacter rubeus TaxID=2027860 RepID=A0A5C1I3J6_9SPHI|nr:hypothetical protein [Mucilaginibacter rubeus]QEM12409.1 hypothetical protein DEO27_021100 [Mucilaginibacter rubeus]
MNQTVFYNNAMCLNPPPCLEQVPEDFGIVSSDGGQTQIKLGDYIAGQYLQKRPNLLGYEKLKLQDERVFTRWNNSWLLTEFTVTFKWNKPACLVYMKSAELLAFQSQWEGKKITSEFRVRNLSLPEQERWIIIGNPYDMPVHCHLLYEKPMKLPEEDMEAWIPRHIVYKGD